MSIKHWAIAYLMEVLEGPFAEDEYGGKTYWGIAEKQSRTEYEHLSNEGTTYGNQTYGTWPPTKLGAIRFYQFWWDRNQCDLLPPMAAAIWFWFTVHIGEPRARRVLQKALTTLISTVELKVDGIIGNKTTRAMLEAQAFPEFSRHFRVEIVKWYHENLPGFAYQRRIYPET